MSQAVPMGPATWRTESGSGGQFCVLGTFDNTTLDVFGTMLNLSSVGEILCTGTFAPPTVSGHCQAVAGAAVMDYDFAGSTTGAMVPIGEPSPFVLPVSNMSGSAVAGLDGNLTYTVDGVQIQRPSGAASTTIPGCPVIGPVVIFDGTGGYNAFQATATGTGTNVPVSTTVSFTDPNTGQPRSIGLDISFDSVTGGGDTVVTATSNVAGNIASNFAVDLGGYNALYFDVSTTATFSGPVDICSPYDDVDNDGFLDGTSIPESALRILHGEGGPPVTFVDRTSSLNTDTNVICAQVTSLSPFVIAIDVMSQTTHDSVLLTAAPLKVTIPDGKTEVVKKLVVKVQNADIAEPSGHTAELTIAASTCPQAMLRDAMNQPVIADFDPSPAVTTNSVVIAAGKVKAAAIPLTIKANDFASPSKQSPVRCTITLSTTAVDAGTVIDPNPSNNSVRIDISVTDKNDF